MFVFALLILLALPCGTFAQDADGDGVNDATELHLGSNYLDPDITPTIIIGSTTTSVSEAPVMSSEPYMAWSGSEFGVAWHDSRTGPQEYFFSRLDKDGNTVVPNLRISNDNFNQRQPFLVWTGSECGLTGMYHDSGNYELGFMRTGQPCRARPA